MPCHTWWRMRKYFQLPLGGILTDQNNFFNAYSGDPEPGTGRFRVLRSSVRDVVTTRSSGGLWASSSCVISLQCWGSVVSSALLKCGEPVVIRFWLWSVGNRFSDAVDGCRRLVFLLSIQGCNGRSMAGLVQIRHKMVLANLGTLCQRHGMSPKSHRHDRMKFEYFVVGRITEEGFFFWKVGLDFDYCESQQQHKNTDWISVFQPAHDSPWCHPCIPHTTKLMVSDVMVSWSQLAMANMASCWW